jgi:hypothetical protein
MYDPFANLPSVDHLVEGRDYIIFDWNFSDPAGPATNKPQENGCPPNEKMVFGVCRKIGGSGERDWDTKQDTAQEKQISEAAKKQGSTFDANKPVTVNGKRYGWAKKNGRPVLVAWGSVAGEKKVGPKEPKAKSGRGGGTGRRRSEGGSDSSRQGRIQGLREAYDRQTTDSGRLAIEEQIKELGGSI